MKKTFWSLVIEPGWVQSAIWTLDGDTTKVLSVGPSVGWEDKESLISSSDATISSAVTSLPEDVEEPSKTVFGVPPSWVSDGQIKREHLDKLREVCGKLSLEPTGFVVLPEAISHYIKASEESALNAVVVGVSKEFLDITVFKLGNLVGTVNVGRSVSAVDDVVEGLARFPTHDSLPSRFLIYDGQTGELEEFRQALIAGDWLGEISGKLKFLHTPSVEIVEPRDKMLAVSLAGASEIASVNKVSFVDNLNETVVHHKEEQPKAQEEVSETVESSDIADVDAKEFGFENESERQDHDNLIPVKEHKISTNRKLNLFSGLKVMTSSMPKPHKLAFSHSFTDKFKPRKGLRSVGFLIVAILIAGSLAWWFLPKAEVLIYVAPRNLEKKEDIVFDFQKQSLEIENNIIPAMLKEIEVSGDKTNSTTGKKTVGEKAGGKATIRNGTAVGIKLNAGVVLVDSNNLKFDLKSEASVSAAESPSAPGTLTVDIAAQNIGSEYNLSKGTTFKVGNYPKSDVDAVIDSDLSGGSSRDITAVAASDIKNLEESLIAELKDQGKTKLMDSIGTDEVFVSEAIVFEVSSKNFNHKLNDEADTLKLEMTGKIFGVVAKKQDILNFSKGKLQDQIPGGFAMRQDQITFEFSPEDGGKNDTSWASEIHFKINLLPEIDPIDIASKISGKYPDVAQSYLSTIPGFSRARIKLIPNLPTQIATLPRVPKNILIEIAADR